MLSPRFNQREWRKREREQMSALPPWKLLSAGVTDRKNRRREGEKDVRDLVKEQKRKCKAGWGRKVWCWEKRRWVWKQSVVIISALQLRPTLLPASLSLSTMPGESLSIMCSDSVRRWRIIPVFSAATACPSSSLHPPPPHPLSQLHWQVRPGYHCIIYPQPRLCHSASFAQREVWKVCMCASVSVCLHVWGSWCVDGIVYMCVYVC